MPASNGDTACPPSLEQVCLRLAEHADRTAAEGPWASGSIDLLAERGVLARFLPADCGGTAATEPVLIATLTAIATSCLTTALALSQWAAAVRIIAAGPPEVRAALLPSLARGDSFTTVGLSQLTTSRQHLGRPVLAAERDDGGDDGWRLDGLCPWVTGADAADTIVTGAALAEGGQAFFVVPTAAAGVAVEPPLEMLALSGSRTAVVRFSAARPAHVILPPEQNAARTGGLATTALALGAARSSLGIVAAEAARRAELAAVAASLEAEQEAIAARLARAAIAGIAAADRDTLRGAATGLALRAAQAALTASKGAGFVRGHPVERLVRESLFFLVWSCPQAVSAALLCEFAGVEA